MGEPVQGGEECNDGKLRLVVPGVAKNPRGAIGPPAMKFGHHEHEPVDFNHLDFVGSTNPHKQGLGNGAGGAKEDANRRLSIFLFAKSNYGQALIAVLKMSSKKTTSTGYLG